MNSASPLSDKDENTWHVLETLFHQLCELPASQHAQFLNENRIDKSMQKLLLNMVNHQANTGALLGVHAAALFKTVKKTNAKEWIGKKLGDYTVTGVLGEGGSAMVLRAKQHKPVTREVAIKMPYLETPPSLINRFSLEQSSLAKLNHPNIATIYSVGYTEEGQPYQVMEFIEGKTLLEHCEHYRLNIKQRLGLFTKICEGMGYSHQNGVLHRDIKPENILVRRLETEDIPLIIDFGIAQELNFKEVKNTNEIRLGTPEFMSPEHLSDSKSMDVRSDVYALGMLLMSLLVDKPIFSRAAFNQAKQTEKLDQLKEFKPKSLITYLDTLPYSQLAQLSKQRGLHIKQFKKAITQEVDWIFQKATQWDKQHRFATVQGLSADIRRLSENKPLQSAQKSKSYIIKKFFQRNALLSSLSILLLLSGAFFTGVTYQQKQAIQVALTEVTTQKNRAEEERQIAEQTTLLMSDMFASMNYQNSTEPQTPLEAVDQAWQKLQSNTTLTKKVRYRTAIKLAELYWEFDQTEKSRSIYLSIVNRTDILDPIIDILANLGLSKTYGRSDSTKALMKQYATTAYSLAQQHPVSVSTQLRTLIQMAQVHLFYEDWPTLLSTRKAIWDMSRDYYGDKHVKTAYRRNEYAYALWRNGQSEQAEKVLLAALKDYQNLFQADDDIMQNTQFYLVYIWKSLEKNMEQVVGLSEERIKASQQRYGEVHSAHLETVLNAIWHMVYAGQFELALAHAKRTDEIIQNNDIPKRHYMVLPKFFMAWMYTAMEYYPEATRHLKNWQTQLKNDFPKYDHHSFLWLELALRQNQIHNIPPRIKQLKADLHNQRRTLKSRAMVTIALAEIELNAFKQAEISAQKAHTFLQDNFVGKRAMCHLTLAMQAYAQYQLHSNESSRIEFLEHANKYLISPVAYPFYASKIEQWIKNL